MSSSSGGGKFHKINPASQLIAKENKQTDHRGLDEIEIEIISAIWATDDLILFAARQQMKNLKLVLEIRDPRVVVSFIHEFYDNFSVWFLCF